jgi:amidase
VLPCWPAAHAAAIEVLFGEAYRSNRDLADHHADEIGDETRARLESSRSIDDARLAAALALRDPWRAELAEAFRRVELLALPSVEQFAFRIGGPGAPNPMAVAVNLSGHPALSLPVPAAGRFPASLQLVGPDGSEEALVAAGAEVEAAVAG